MAEPMTRYSEALLEEAKDQWSRGYQIDLILFSNMVAQGLDVEQLKEIYFKES